MTNNKLSHVALILDGNKRWAKKNSLPSIQGYKQGFDNIKNLVEYSLSLNINDLTLFTLSSENFNRPSLDLIYEIIYSNFTKLIDELITKKNIKIKIIGSRKNLPKKIINIFNEVEKISFKNSSLNLNLAFNYGFKEEIKEVLINYRNNIDKIDLDSNDDISNLFYLGLSSDPDLLIRTGGYKRLSNFIMYNLTYTELYFTDTLWPEFTSHEFENIINQYKKITRKYGL